MRTSWAIYSVFSAAMMSNAVFGYGSTVYVRSCDELPPGELKMSGMITFVGNIWCLEPRVVHVDDDLMLLSHEILDTTNIHFKVHKGATMTLHSPGMIITRDQGSTVPLFDVSGQVTFQATGSIPGLMRGSVKDEGGVINITRSGTAKTAQKIRYGTDAVIVSKMPKPGEELGVSSQQAAELNPMYKAFLAARHAEMQAGAGGSSSSSSSSPTSSSFSTPSYSPSSATPSPPANGDTDGKDDFVFLASDSDAPGEADIRHSAQSIHSPIDTEDANGQDDNARQPIANADYHGSVDNESPSTSPIDSPTAMPTPTSDPISTANTFGGGPRDASSGIPSASTNPSFPSSPNSPSRSPSPSPSPSPGHPYGHSPSHDDRQSPTSTPGSSSSPGGQQKDSDEHGSDSQSNNPRVVPGPKLALKVGQVRLPPFLSGSGRSAMWPADDGSVMFSRISEEFSGDIMGSEEKKGRVVTVMVAPDAGRLERVFNAGKVLREETREDHDSTRTKGVWGAWGWVTGGRQLRRDVDKAREHLGEVAMTFDDRACVEVTVDGICVLSKSGRYKREWMNRFPWRRRKDSEYELFVTEEGMEVHLGEKKIWGVSAADVMD